MYYQIHMYKEVCCHLEHISKKKVAPSSFCFWCLVVVYSLRLEWSGHRIINSATISPPNLALSSSVGRRYAGRKILVISAHSVIINCVCLFADTWSAWSTLRPCAARRRRRPAPSCASSGAARTRRPHCSPSTAARPPSPPNRLTTSSSDWTATSLYYVSTTVS